MKAFFKEFSFSVSSSSLTSLNNTNSSSSTHGTSPPAPPSIGSLDSLNSSRASSIEKDKLNPMINNSTTSLITIKRNAFLTSLKNVDFQNPILKQIWKDLCLSNNVDVRNSSISITTSKIVQPLFLPPSPQAMPIPNARHASLTPVEFYKVYEFDVGEENEALLGRFLSLVLETFSVPVGDFNSCAKDYEDGKK